jgi:hypothetical protein
MRNATNCFLTLFLGGIALAVPNMASLLGQTPATAVVGSASSTSHVQPDPSLKGKKTHVVTPESDPETEEAARYSFFLLHIYSLDEAARSMQASGNLEMAQHVGSLLQVKSGLTEEESSRVKEIAAEYKRAVDASNEMGRQLERGDVGKPTRPTDPVQAAALNASYAALQLKNAKDINDAIARLVAALGSRSFSRLDLYTRHYTDEYRAQTERSKANKLAASQAGGTSTPVAAKP